MSVEDVIRDQDAFIAIITPNFVKEPERFEECEIAQRLEKPMYAFIQEGTNWDKFKIFPWKGTFPFGDFERDKKAIESAILRIRKSLGEKT